jgi:hypothetical protein
VKNDLHLFEKYIYMQVYTCVEGAPSVGKADWLVRLDVSIVASTDQLAG